MGLEFYPGNCKQKVKHLKVDFVQWIYIRNNLNVSDHGIG